MNISDSERIAGFLESIGFRPEKDEKKSAVVIFNTCGVRQMSEDRIYGLIHNLHEARPKTKIILTGCLADRKDVQRRLKNKADLFCAIKDFQKKFNDFLNCHPELFLKSKKISEQVYNDSCDYLKTIPKYSSKNTVYVPIMTGCNNFCTYCVVPYARGREISRPEKDIFSEIENLSKQKYKKIILLGQNVNSYKYKTITFPKLLDSIAKKFPKIEFKFITSYPKDFSEELMEVIAKNKNIDREIHLPIQAGSDKILKAMNRPYTKKHYLGLISKAKKIIPGVAFTTDVIVGFPGETEKDFKESIDVFEKVKYNEAYINKYSPRPGTAAYVLGNPISWEEKKRREKILRKIIRQREK